MRREELELAIATAARTLNQQGVNVRTAYLRAFLRSDDDGRTAVEREYRP